MTANERAGLAENNRRNLNHLHSCQNCVERLFRSRQATRSTGILEGKARLALDLRKFAALCITGTQDGQCLRTAHIFECDGDEHGGVQIDDSHQSWSRSFRIAAIAGEASI